MVKGTKKGMPEETISIIFGKVFGHVSVLPQVLH
jgi:hypothetical protein